MRNSASSAPFMSMQEMPTPPMNTRGASDCRTDGFHLRGGFNLRRLAAHLLLDPLVGRLEALDERGRWRPVELLPDQLVVRVAPAHAGRSRDVHEVELLAGDADDHLGQLVDGDHLLGAD